MFIHLLGLKIIKNVIFSKKNNENIHELHLNQQINKGRTNNFATGSVATVYAQYDISVVVALSRKSSKLKIQNPYNILRRYYKL